MLVENEQGSLATELDFYFAHKQEWLGKHCGCYVVIQDMKVLGFYPLFETAFRAGVNALGVTRNFLVRQVLEEEPVFFVF